jgi:hypothetical protein
MAVENDDCGARSSRALPRQTIARLGVETSSPDEEALVLEEQSADPEAARLARWWSDLSEAHRREAFGLAPQNPMPRWMVHGLEKAEISGLVQREGEPDDMPPWIAMPDDVKRLIARHRRRG